MNFNQCLGTTKKNKRCLNKCSIKCKFCTIHKTEILKSFFSYAIYCHRRHKQLDLIPVNTEDVFSMEPINEISPERQYKIIQDNKLYIFDLFYLGRYIQTNNTNPYNNNEFNIDIINNIKIAYDNMNFKPEVSPKKNTLIKVCKKINEYLNHEWIESLNSKQLGNIYLSLRQLYFEKNIPMDNYLFPWALKVFKKNKLTIINKLVDIIDNLCDDENMCLMFISILTMYSRDARLAFEYLSNITGFPNSIKFKIFVNQHFNKRDNAIRIFNILGIDNRTIQTYLNTIDDDQLLQIANSIQI